MSDEPYDYEAQQAEGRRKQEAEISFDTRLWQHSPDCKPWCHDNWPDDALVCYCKRPALTGRRNGGDTDLRGFAPDGRPFFVGTMQYETWVKDDKRTEQEKK